MPALQVNSRALLHQFHGALPSEAIHVTAALEDEAINPIAKAMAVGNGDDQPAIGLEHTADFARLDTEAAAEIMQLAQRLQAALDTIYHPDGYNLGMNLGRSAGAGIAGHLHMHLLPRWAGDTNFMTTVGETRLEPEELATTYAKLRRALGM